MDKLQYEILLALAILSFIAFNFKPGKCFGELLDNREEDADDRYLDNLLSELRTTLDIDEDEPEKSGKFAHDQVEVNAKEKKNKIVNIQMPGVSPQKHDSYICVAKKMPQKDTYIVGYEPHAEMHTAHHMLMFGCEEPTEVEEGKTWDCREMHPVCKTGMQHILYAWGRNAPALKLPKDVGFKVGGKTEIKYLVLQVHYGSVDKFKGTGIKDYSGVKLSTTKIPKRYLAGIYLLAAGWDKIPPHREILNMDVGCSFPANSPTIYPFAFRTHTHSLGVVVSGYRVRDGIWTEIGRGDPQCPQAFYKVKKQGLDIRPGDYTFGRCTYNSTKRDTVTNIGATKKDEMCNFYIMYFFDAKCLQSFKCTTMPTTMPPFGCGYIDVQSEQMMKNFPKISQEPLKNFCVHEKGMGGKKSKEPKVDKSEYTGYQVVKNWPRKNADTGSLPKRFGQVTGIDLDHHGNVVVFHRAYRFWDASTFTYDEHLNKNLGPIEEDTVAWLKKTTGKVTKTWGKGKFYMPHGLTIDREGNMWLTDVGMHQVFKYNLKKSEKPLLVLGEKLQPGSDDHHFCKPTDVAVDSTGVFYVSDGYCNSRIMMFSAKGQLLMKITNDNLKPAYSMHRFNVPHSLSLDTKNNILFVADRENARVIMFNSLNGKFKREIANIFGDSVYAIAYSPEKGGLLHVVSGAGATNVAKGYTYTLYSDKKDLKDLLITWQPPAGFHRPHDLAVSKKSNHIYVCEIGPNKIWKFEKKQFKLKRT